MSEPTCADCKGAMKPKERYRCNLCTWKRSSAHSRKRLCDASPADWIAIAGLLSMNNCFQQAMRGSDEDATKAEKDRSRDIIAAINEEGGTPMFFAFVEDGVIDIRKVLLAAADDAQIEQLVEQGWRLSISHRNKVWATEVRGIHPAYFPSIPRLVRGGGQ